VQVFGIAVALYLILSYGLSAVAALIGRLTFRAPAGKRIRRRPSALSLIGARS
jgi:polar amino acid transport system permease protein